MQLVVETKDSWMILCHNKGCGYHCFPKAGKPGARWSFNGSLDHPTFSPSMNEACNQPDMKDHRPGLMSSRCHFIVSAGQIYYCSDCTHNFRERSMPMLAFDEAAILYYAGLRKTEGW